MTVSHFRTCGASGLREVQETPSHPTSIGVWGVVGEFALGCVNNLISLHSDVTPQLPGAGAGYMQAPRRASNALLRSLGQLLGHDKPCDDCEALILLDNFPRHHRSSYSVQCSGPEET